nr:MULTISPECIES: alpha/beta fold hydrolase [unclassified Nostoc]
MPRPIHSSVIVITGASSGISRATALEFAKQRATLFLAARREMDAVGIEKATMLGNSFGCQIISEFAFRYGDRLERAILQVPTVDRHARTLPQQLWRFFLNAPIEDPSETLVQLYDYWQAGLTRIVRTGMHPCQMEKHRKPNGGLRNLCGKM